MNIKTKIRIALREAYGEFNTNLEHQYENKLTENLMMGDLEKSRAWLTYNQVILEFKNALKNTLKVRELQYMLTEDLNPNQACIDVMKEVKSQSPELERLYNKIANFE
jgi:hypothetical protein